MQKGIFLPDLQVWRRKSGSDNQARIEGGPNISLQAVTRWRACA